jgi:hypothetical protein
MLFRNSNTVDFEAVPVKHNLLFSMGDYKLQSS